MTDSVLMEVDNDPQVGEKRKADKGKAPMSAADEAKKNQMWVEKYRPSRLADVAAHKDIIDTISRLSTEDKLPHLLLYGPPGTGKTSTILALAKELYGASFAQMVLELLSGGTLVELAQASGRLTLQQQQRIVQLLTELGKPATHGGAAIRPGDSGTPANYVADASGYLGSVVLLVWRNFAMVSLDWLNFFIASAYATSIVGAACAVLAGVYFLRHRPATPTVTTRTVAPVEDALA